MTRRAPKVLLPPTTATRTTVTTRSKHSTVPRGALDVIGKPPRPARLPAPPPKPKLPKKPRVAHIVGDDEESLLDLIDNLLAKGVVLNADLILALANVDLVYVRLSALLCAADRVLGPISPKPRRGEGG